MRPDSGNPPPLDVREEAGPGLAAIKETDPDFSIEVFGEEVHRLLLEVYAAWNQEHINGLSGRVKESLLEYLLMGLKIMSLREERSYLEDMILEGVTGHPSQGRRRPGDNHGVLSGAAPGLRPG